MLRRSQGFLGAALFLGATSIACSTTPTDTSVAGRALEAKGDRVEALETALREKENLLESQQGQIDRLARKLERVDVASPPPGGSFAVGDDLLPPAAQPGQCYARVMVPAKYKTDNVRVLKREASEKIAIVPAQFEWVEERVLVKEASEKITEVPAVYEWVEEKVLVKPAHTAWKRGSGPIQRVDNATGEIMCLVEVPAEYKTVKKRVLKAPATTRRITVPAEYKTVRVRKMKTPPQENRTAIPAQYEDVSKRIQTAEARMEWRSVLCQTNASPQLISQVQRALGEAGHNPGPIDGRLGGQTLAAVRAYQAKKGLPTGGLTLTTLNSLGVRVGR